MILQVTVEVAAADQQAAEKELREFTAQLGWGEIAEQRFFPNGDDSPRHLWQRAVAVVREGKG